MKVNLADGLTGGKIQVELQREYALDDSFIALRMREKRDRLLLESDWTQLPDVSISEEKKQAWRSYRKALRDLPGQKGFPYVDFPAKP
jgi:hypothetical protein